MGNAGKGAGSRLAGRAAVASRSWRRKRRMKQVSGWLTLEIGERSVAGTAEKRVGGEEWILSC